MGAFCHVARPPTVAAIAAGPAMDRRACGVRGPGGLGRQVRGELWRLARRPPRRGSIPADHGRPGRPCRPRGRPRLRPLQIRLVQIRLRQIRPVQDAGASASGSGVRRPRLPLRSTAVSGAARDRSSGAASGFRPRRPLDASPLPRFLRGAFCPWRPDRGLGSPAGADAPSENPRTHLVTPSARAVFMEASGLRSRFRVVPSVEGVAERQRVDGDPPLPREAGGVRRERSDPRP